MLLTTLEGGWNKDTRRYFFSLKQTTGSIAHLCHYNLDLIRCVYLHYTFRQYCFFLFGPDGRSIDVVAILLSVAELKH